MSLFRDIFKRRSRYYFSDPVVQTIALPILAAFVEFGYGRGR